MTANALLACARSNQPGRAPTEPSDASQGVEITQILERTEQGTASGTADLPGFDMRGIPVSAYSRLTLRPIPR